VTWRFFAILTTLSVALVVNGWLLATEDVEPPKAAAEVVNATAQDPLRMIAYMPSTRLENFLAFGFSEDLAEVAFAQTRRMDDRKGFLEEMVRRDREVLSPVLCPSGSLPQRYAALKVLVQEENGKLVVISGTTMTYAEAQEWYAGSSVREVYEAVELSSTRKADATVMGVGGVLLQRDSDVIEGRAPWGGGMMNVGWSFGDMVERWPSVTGDLIAYFATMHVLTEIANAQGGICD
jgi:hypothetical protein